ncbi:hypothetical protein O6P43_006140 [Quillaja saponaria]|uniref:Uncharacterized protein n=1 Tax=Quillaja saponaria TaxID=32244 RepID=A0AAD7Q7L5_QUISA|nr:hypothetical protein O6P43_006140 [Quillaja saponaria]
MLMPTNLDTKNKEICNSVGNLDMRDKKQMDGLSSSRVVLWLSVFLLGCSFGQAAGVVFRAQGPRRLFVCGELLSFYSSCFLLALQFCLAGGASCLSQLCSS